MPISKPTKEELSYWDEILNPGRDTINARPNLFYAAPLDEATGVKIPAQPVRNGGILWRDRIFIEDKKQARNRRVKHRHICPSCGRKFDGTRRAKYCGTRCRVRAYDQREAVKRSYAKLTIHSEGSTK